MISTMMACPNMDTERLVLEALNKVASFTLDQDKSKLSLLDENGTEVMSLTKKIIKLNTQNTLKITVCV